ncbi:MAG: hypothetical protein UT66_C0001G0031 [candidate division CPR2 bacterium GW2011_GWC1_39_9]|uniref:Uncharacterized protein n=1 Tax=candidate division CPR2 bacterium GW2011_GWC2_39_10 TaxID=1618345 RepID=A0A0G0Q198_UNCC2|nr:MAG: hypothetical protein UT18_C0001G0033 [candidate division CPR2 bacterium GW2011_GWC2_39_10]KKR36207.1 MAG: hypothetical protein UT66_C0001G0031 [candidate division CPR2 bacterium GW2011_GWC1_39_9]
MQELEMIDRFVEEGKYKEALQKVNMLISAGSNDLRLQFKRAFILQVSGRPLEAKIIYEYTIREDPKNCCSLYNLAVIYYQLGNIRNAKKFAKYALRSFPSYIHALDLLARMAAEENRYSDVLRLSRQMILIDKDNVRAKNYLIFALTNLTRYSDAIEEGEKAIQFQKTPLIYYLVGFCHEKLDNAVKARANYEIASEMGSTEASDKLKMLKPRLTVVKNT